MVSSSEEDGLAKADPTELRSLSQTAIDTHLVVAGPKNTWELNKPAFSKARSHLEGSVWEDRKKGGKRPLTGIQKTYISQE